MPALHREGLLLAEIKTNGKGEEEDILGQFGSAESPLSVSGKKRLLSEDPAWCDRCD